MRFHPPRSLGIVAALLLLLAPSAGASAHDLWITTIADGDAVRAVVNFGHPAEREAPDLHRLLDLVLISPGGATSLREGTLGEQRIDGAPVLVSQRFAVPAAGAVLAGRYDNGYWVKTPHGYRKASKRLFPGAEDSLWAVKFAKTLLGPGAYATVVGHELELVPLDDPFRLAAGAPLRIRVLFRGTALANAAVELGDGVSPIADKDIPRFRSGSDGVAALPIDRRGPFVLAVDYRAAGKDPALAASDYYNATLAFRLR